MTPACVVFDCDGVLLDSNRMKTQTFATILAAYPTQAVEAFLAYQATAFGLSRYRMIDAFFEHHLERPASPGEKDELLAAFGRECRQQYPRQALTEGVVEVLEDLRRRDIPMFVVSGSDEAELISVLEELDMARYFRQIFGSPATKVANLKRVAEVLGDVHQITFVGDAKADWMASQEHGCDFVYLSPWSADPATMRALQQAHGFPEIRKLADMFTCPSLPLARHASMESRL